MRTTAEIEVMRTIHGKTPHGRMKNEEYVQNSRHDKSAKHPNVASSKREQTKW